MSLVIPDLSKVFHGSSTWRDLKRDGLDYIIKSFMGPISMGNASKTLSTYTGAESERRFSKVKIVKTYV